MFGILLVESMFNIAKKPVPFLELPLVILKTERGCSARELVHSKHP